MEKDKNDSHDESQEAESREREEQQENQDDDGQQEEENDSQDSFRAKLNAQNRFLEKEGYEFRDGKWQRKPEPKTESKNDDQKKSDDELSQLDLIALAKSDVHEDDIPEVQRMAKLLNITVREALKDESVKTILERRVEYRKTANAMNTKTKRPSGKQLSGAELLEQARKTGKYPKAGTPEAEAIFKYKKGIKD